MNVRRASGAIACFVILACLLMTTGILATPARQPEPAAPGAPAPAIEAAYLAAQADRASTDEARVQSAVDTYFTLKYESRVQGQALDLGIVVDRSTAAGEQLHDYELGRLQYSLLDWQQSNTVFESCNYRPVYADIKIKGRTATARVHPWVDLSYADDPDRVEPFGGELHTVTLTRAVSGWRVTNDSYDDEFIRYLPRGTDFAALQASLGADLAAAAERQAALEQSLRSDPRAQSRFGASASGDAGILTYRTYDRARCATYGTTYTSNSADCATSSYNSLFAEWASGGRCTDCQNFVSQCVWYGFGGTNTSTAIQGHYLPMVYNISGATAWWEDRTTTGTNWTWTYVPAFRDLITNNWNSDKVGPQGYEGSLGLEWAGDYIAMSDWSHVYIVVGITDYDGDGTTDYNEIYVSAHTNNRNNVRLSSLVSQSSVRFMWVLTFKNP